MTPPNLFYREPDPDRWLRPDRYPEPEFRALLGRSRGMIFRCEPETQGIAYQQALSAGVPIFAWNRGEYWRAPGYYPTRAAYGPVTSVPYWSDACGLKFADLAQFEERLDAFLKLGRRTDYDPRSYVIANLGLVQCAEEYLAHVDAVTRDAAAPSEAAATR